AGVNVPKEDALEGQEVESEPAGDEEIGEIEEIGVIHIDPQRKQHLGEDEQGERDARLEQGGDEAWSERSACGWRGRWRYVLSDPFLQSPRVSPRGRREVPR